MITLLVCCISSIISAIVGFFFRKQITGALGKMGGGAPAAAPAAAPTAAPAAAARGRAAVKARRLKIKAGRKIRKMFRRRRRPKRRRPKRRRRIFGRRRSRRRRPKRRRGVKRSSPSPPAAAPPAATQSAPRLTNTQAVCYMVRYPVLGKRHGFTNYTEAQRHWNNIGFKEKRNGTCDGLSWYQRRRVGLITSINKIKD